MRTVTSRTGRTTRARYRGQMSATGTHFDAPVHFIPAPGSGLPERRAAGDDHERSGAARTAHRSLRSSSTLRASLVRRPTVAAPRSARTRSEAFEREHGVIAPGDVVLLRTGWDSHYVAGDRGRRYIANGAWPAPDARPDRAPPQAWHALHRYRHTECRRRGGRPPDACGGARRGSRLRRGSRPSRAAAATRGAVSLPTAKSPRRYGSAGAGRRSAGVRYMSAIPVPARRPAPPDS